MTVDSYVKEMDWGELDLANYRAYQYERIAPYVGERVLEVGSGDRTFSQEIVKGRGARLKRLLSIEPSDTLFEMHRHRSGFPDAVDFERYDLFSAELKHQAPFDSVIMIHVLEHIDDDARAVRCAQELLAPGGHLLIEVPAIPWLYSEHDKSIGHYRRYSRGALRKVLNIPGFKLKRLTWHDPIGAVGSFYFFKMRRTKLKTEAGQNLVSGQGRIYDRWIVPVERTIERHVPMPFGLSLTAVAQKV